MSGSYFNCLSEQHLLLFGTITQWFARYELLLDEIIATIIGSDAATVLLLIGDLSFGSKRQVLLDLLRHRSISLDQFDRVYAFLDVPETLLPLRNDIAHSAWIRCENPNSIQPEWIFRSRPSIRPLHDDPHAPSESFVETAQDKIGYTMEDLIAMAARLATNYELFTSYLSDKGLIPEISN